MVQSLLIALNLVDPHLAANIEPTSASSLPFEFMDPNIPKKGKKHFFSQLCIINQMQIGEKTTALKYSQGSPMSKRSSSTQQSNLPDLHQLRAAELIHRWRL